MEPVGIVIGLFVLIIAGLLYGLTIVKKSAYASMEKEIGDRIWQVGIMSILNTDGTLAAETDWVKRLGNTIFANEYFIRALDQYIGNLDKVLTVTDVRIFLSNMQDQFTSRLLHPDINTANFYQTANVLEAILDAYEEALDLDYELIECIEFGLEYYTEQLVNELDKRQPKPQLV